MCGFISELVISDPMRVDENRMTNQFAASSSDKKYSKIIFLKNWD